GFSLGTAAMVAAAVAVPVVAVAIATADTDTIVTIAGDVLNTVVDNVVNRIGDMAEVAVETTTGVGCMLGVSSSCSGSIL
ncbi:MAG: hypothetical protein K9G11_03985, partial [Rickettsiaceae bacterium]|nr:hypothetical protein [Rickettsiaceae bacterium]